MPAVKLTTVGCRGNMFPCCQKPCAREMWLNVCFRGKKGSLTSVISSADSRTLSSRHILSALINSDRFSGHSTLAQVHFVHCCGLFLAFTVGWVLLILVGIHKSKLDCSWMDNRKQEFEIIYGNLIEICLNFKDMENVERNIWEIYKFFGETSFSFK